MKHVIPVYVSPQERERNRRKIVPRAAALVLVYGLSTEMAVQIAAQKVCGMSCKLPTRAALIGGAA